MDVMQIIVRFAAMTGADSGTLAQGLLAIVNNGGDRGERKVTEYFAHLRELVDLLEGALIQQCEQRAQLAHQREQEARQEIDLLNSWLDLPAYGREV